MVPGFLKWIDLFQLHLRKQNLSPLDIIELAVTLDFIYIYVNIYFWPFVACSEEAP